MQRGILSFSFLFLLFCGINAQMTFSPEEPSAENNACDVAQSDIFIANTSSDMVELVWRIDRVDVPAEWELQICDAITCYSYGVESTPPGDTRINRFNPDQGFTYMVKAKPNGIDGIGDMDMVLTDANDPSVVYETIPIVITITNCVVSNDEINEDSNIGLFPNPTFGTFKLTEQNSVDRISVYNIIGKEVVSFSATANGNYDVSDLENGMFLVRLFDQKGETLKVLRLSKR